MRNQIRRDKFDLVFPQAMRENGIDMWITVMKEGNFDPLYLELGQGYVSSIGLIIFADVGKERIERALSNEVIVPGRTRLEDIARWLQDQLEAAGFAVMKEFNKPTNTEKTEVIAGCHSVGD